MDGRTIAGLAAAGSALAGPALLEDLRRARACWVGRDAVVWREGIEEDRSLSLAWDLAGDLAARLTQGPPPPALPLTFDPHGLETARREKFPHLAGLPVFRLEGDRLEEAGAALRGQSAVVARDETGRIVAATALQIPGVVDELYPYDGPLGVTFDRSGTPSFHLWAPTARKARLLLYPLAEGGPEQHIPLARDPATGAWSARGEAAWEGWYYLYEVEVFVRATGRFETNRVTDPWSVSLSRNSRRSQAVDLGSPALKPPGWNELAKPPLAGFHDVVLYELHLRDFSAADPTVPEPWRGTFKAFSLPQSNGMRHLRILAEAGVTHVHLLPLSDIATIEEDRSLWREPEGDLSVLPPDSGEQQHRIAALGAADPFNWGYDPLHYRVPEGSYATDPQGPARLSECREMVAALAGAGLRTVMDVVFNHTFASGQDPLSVLDRIVPGYYHRLNAEGEVETSTVCANTATEHAMMERLMVDSVVTWAREYKVDGFRFDLMGHHMKRNLLAVRAALDALTLERDGVDGRAVYLYGEGWNFGEVADGARGEQAIRENLRGTGIGTFNDRLRDAVRGGGAFHGLREQGFATGLFTAPNGASYGSPEEQRGRLLAATGALRASLAAADTDLPWEAVSYVESHDNETLFDAVQVKAPAEATLTDRVRMHNLAVSTVALAQGVPFFHAGVELLRSKSGDRNSYHSGDWFNRLDFSRKAHNWGAGLPPGRDNGDRWPLLAPLLADPALKPGPAEIEAAYRHFLEMLAIRRSSPLFRLRSADEVRRRLGFLNAGPDPVPGFLGFRLDDPEGETDPAHDLVVVLFNGSDETLVLDLPELRGRRLALHPVLRRSHDRVARAASFHRTLGAVSLPGRTTAVFWG